MISLFIDKYGHISSKRICGITGFFVFLFMALISGFNFYQIDPTIVIGGLGTCAGLLASTAFEKEPISINNSQFEREER